MKLRIIYIRPIFLTAFLIFCFQSSIFSQGTDISNRGGKQGHFYIGFSASPARTAILNTGTSVISQLVSTKKISFISTFEVGYCSKFFGFSTGIGYSAYASNLSLDAYDNKFDTIDSEHENYTRLISGKNIIETQKISFLNIPLVASLQLPFTNNFGFYLQTGVNLSLPMTKSYSSSGTFTYTGYYKTYNVSITGVTYEGFLKDNTTSKSGDLLIKSLNPELIASSGFYVTINNKTQFVFGVLYNKMLSDISGYTPNSSFQLSSFPNQMNSLMEGSSKVSTSSLGIKISFRIFL